MWVVISRFGWRFDGGWLFIPLCGMSVSGDGVVVVEGYEFSMEEVGYELLHGRRWFIGYSGRWDGGGLVLVGTQHGESMVS